MNLLGAVLYDPSTAAAKSTASLLAMTAFDTTNLRLTVTVPAHGMVRFRLQCAIEGATTYPEILLGVLNGSTVVGRVAPLQVQGATALATTRLVCLAEFTATGLSAGSTNFDAAYGVEIVVASTNIKYGGPNNTTTDDAWGAFVFEAWDPRPLTLALDGAVNVKQFGGTNGTFASGRPEVNTTHLAGTAQTARDIGASVLLSSGTGTGQLDFTSGVVKGNVTQVDGTSLTAHASGKVPADVLTVAGTTQTARDLGAQLDAAVSTRLATSGYTTPDNASVTAIKAKTDSLAFTVAGQVDANIQSVNDVTVNGTGSASTPWGP